VPKWRARAIAPALASAMLGALACGGTTGRDGLVPDTPAGTPDSSAGTVDAAAGADASADGTVSGPTVDAGTFDVDIQYADRPLPDVYVAPVPEAGSGDDGGGLKPCTAAGQTSCVPCDGNTTGLCTPTEAMFVQHDIDKGLVQQPDGGDGGYVDPMGSCYNCLWNADCIDNTVFADTGKECEDNLQTFGTIAECQATVMCILATKCAASAVSPCYCGQLGLATTCQGASAVPVNGACDSVIATGLGFPLGDGTDNTAKLENTAYAAGRADQIFQCGVIANGCTACQK
jgi:hypothetical protein